MNVIINQTADLTSLSIIKAGETFEYNGSIYLKCSENNLWRYVKLTGGSTENNFEVFDFGEDVSSNTLVKKLVSNLTIEKVETANTTLETAKQLVKTTIDSYKATNNTTLNELQSIIKNVVNTVNSRISVTIHDFKLTKATVSADGKLSFVIHLTISDSNTTYTLYYIDNDAKIIDQIIDPNKTAFDEVVKAAETIAATYNVNDNTGADIIRATINNYTRYSVSTLEIINFKLVKKSSGIIGALSCDIYIENPSSQQGEAPYSTTIKMRRVIE